MAVLGKSKAVSFPVKKPVATKATVNVASAGVKAMTADGVSLVPSADPALLESTRGGCITYARPRRV